MKSFTREEVEIRFNSDDESEMEETKNDFSEGRERSLDSSDDNRIDRALDIDVPADDVPSDLTGPSCPPPAPRQTRARRSVRIAVKKRAPTPSLPADDVPSGLPGPSCPPPAPRQTRARRSVRIAVKKRAPTSKRSTPAPLVDRWHDGSEEDVCPPPFPFCPKRTPGPRLDFQASQAAVGGATASESAAVGGATASLPPEPERRPLSCVPVIVCELSDDPSLKATKGRRRCKLCQALTMWLCRACKVPLCIIPGRCCYTLWHDAKSSQRV
ncbi:microtubule-associated protein homolog maph-1.1-like [Clupea harengus]|uniref:Microtubule-associated protein homolog maph-1.1-like n=1 Tax=Clupea harengus TaxID=7950 RepID=A0A8M1KRA1_CLUHA|nr:microtubule-associated protein homolog maph-1.1-like [Clupea harengus]